MQNIIKETLNAGENIRTGGAKYLLMRDASNSITVQLDTSEPVEIKKNDVVLIDGCTTVMFTNHHETATTIEYQITDMPINTQSDVKGINGSISVNKIAEPVVVSSVQTALTVQRIIEPLNVSFPAKMEVSNFPKAPDVQKVKVENFPTAPSVQKVEVTNHQTESAPTIKALPKVTLNGRDTRTIAANPKRKELIVIAPISNSNHVMVAGFIPISAGGSASVPASNAVTVSGVNGDALLVGEVL